MIKKDKVIFRHKATGKLFIMLNTDFNKKHLQLLCYLYKLIQQINVGSRSGISTDSVNKSDKKDRNVCFCEYTVYT